jgi:hypothetical protein
MWHGQGARWPAWEGSGCAAGGERLTVSAVRRMQHAAHVHHANHDDAIKAERIQTGRSLQELGYPSADDSIVLTKMCDAQATASSQDAAGVLFEAPKAKRGRLPRLSHAHSLQNRCTIWCIMTTMVAMITQFVHVRSSRLKPSRAGRH